MPPSPLLAQYSTCHSYQQEKTWLDICSPMYYAAAAFRKIWLENSHQKCSCNIKARVGGEVNGTEINNGWLDVFANWDRWHFGSKGVCQAKPKRSRSDALRWRGPPALHTFTLQVLWRGSGGKVPLDESARGGRAQWRDSPELRVKQSADQPLLAAAKQPDKH